MSLKLTDIIDLDYFVQQDEVLEVQNGMTHLLERDRAIFKQLSSQDTIQEKRLLSWLDFRRSEWKNERKKRGALLPGSLFDMAYRWLAIVMGVFGLLSGGLSAGSFLIYHGVEPVNVTSFLSVFAGIPLILTGMAGLLLVWQICRKKESRYQRSPSFIYILLLLIGYVTTVVNRIKGTTDSCSQSESTLSYSCLNKKDYQQLFFIPFLLLTSVFALGFSSGAAGITFFKVIVSDMAFGWQSTLVSTSAAVYELVSILAVPWKFFLSESLSTLAHPTLEQIQGSRIILKDGIAVLSTQDLISWWPFVCLSLCFYGLFPRLLFVFAALFAQKKRLARFDLNRPEFNEIVIRMTSSSLDMDLDRNPGEQKETTVPPEDGLEDDTNVPEKLGATSILLIPDAIYTDAAVMDIKQGIESGYGVEIEEIFPVKLHALFEENLLEKMSNLSGPLVFVYEAWQAPIRGILHYISMIRDNMDKKQSLWVVLTGQAESGSLGLENSDPDIKIWKETCVPLKNKGIYIKGLSKK